MGSRLNIKPVDLAYIAGFLDGDGSVMLQIKKRTDTKSGWRFMATICFYQSTNHAAPLYWVRSTLQCGYISKRNDDITELRINGYSQCGTVLTKLQPYIRFKTKQVAALLKAVEYLENRSVATLSPVIKKRLLKYILIIQNNNYQSVRKRSKEHLKIMLGLTP